MHEGKDPHPLVGLIKRLRLHANLTERGADAIKALPYRLSLLGAHQWLAREGDDTSHCTILVDGYIQRFRLTAHGERQISAFYVRGDPIDLDRLYLPVADDSLQAIKGSTIARIESQALRDLLGRQREIADAVITTMLVDASIFREWILNVGQRDAVRRIAHLLCELGLRMEVQGIDVRQSPIPLTQQQIGEATGLTSVHVNRTLKQMTSKRYIGRVGALVTLPDMALLRTVAGFDDRYLHIGYHDRAVGRSPIGTLV